MALLQRAFRPELFEMPRKWHSGRIQNRVETSKIEDKARRLDLAQKEFNNLRLRQGTEMHRKRRVEPPRTRSNLRQDRAVADHKPPSAVDFSPIGNKEWDGIERLPCEAEPFNDV